MKSYLEDKTESCENISCQSFGDMGKKRLHSFFPEHWDKNSLFCSCTMGKPVITNSGWGDVELFKTKIEDLFVVNGFNKSEYQSIINELDKKRKAKPNIPSEFALNYFSLQNGVDKYFGVYRSLWE